MGRSDAAFDAGNMPKNTPTAMENTNAKSTDENGSRQECNILPQNALRIR